MQEWLINLTINYQYLVYGVIVISSFIEGPILAMLCGVLLRLDYLDLVFVYLALMTGDLIGDIFWYSIGYYGGHHFIKRFGKYFSITENGVREVTRIFHDHKDRILIISKITTGFGFALVTLVTAGIVKIPFKRYMLLNICGQFIWTAMLLSVGYFLGYFYLMINGILGKISLIAIFVMIFLLLLGYGKYVRMKMLALNQNI